MKVITCFSYKGGAGRTTAAANIAAALASVTGNVGGIESPLRRKVALIDLDVFSAGTHRVFEITNNDIKDHEICCVQDYLREQMAPGLYIERGGIKLTHECMKAFRMSRGAAGNCDTDFVLFPARPDPDSRFLVQKQHENVLIELLIELENRKPGFDYVILDGESGTRQMADIGLRLADIVLMFFRLTWQHIDGTLNTVEDLQAKTQIKPFYLVPTCVPLVHGEESVYRNGAPGLDELIRLTEHVPRASKLDEFSQDHRDRHFWSNSGGPINRLCVHDSLFLKGEERIIVFDTEARKDCAAQDYYRIAAEINRLHDPSR